MRRTSPVQRSNGTAGFTLLESLVALAIVGIVASVILRCHVCNLRAVRAASAMGPAAEQAERVFVELSLGVEPSALAQELAGEGWKLDWRLVNDSAAGGAGLMWSAWSLTPSNRPSAGIQFCLSPPAGAGSGVLGPAGQREDQSPQNDAVRH